MNCIRILFWNAARRVPSQLVADLCYESRADITIIAEAGDEVDELVRAMSTERRPARIVPAPDGQRLAVFCNCPEIQLEPLRECKYYSIQAMSAPDWEETLLAAVHLPSKLYMSEASQGFQAVELARDIEAVEDMQGHRRTVVIGDFNMNPFEDGMVAAGAMHAVSSAGVAKDASRTVAGREYPYFYNPSWKTLGEKAEGVCGTYFSRRAENVCYFWNAFDQLLIRPDLLHYFEVDNFAVVTEIGSRSLITDAGIPDQAISDHLPIAFSMALPQEALNETT